MIEQNEVVGYVKGAKRGELQSLITKLEDELGVIAAPPTFALPPPTEQVVEEQTEFNTILTGFTGKRVAVIQAVRRLTGLSLKESRNLVDAIPAAIKEAVSRADAEEAAEALRDASGTVEVR